MKVGFITHAAILNGAPITLAELVSGLAARPGHLSLALGVPSPGPLLERYDFTGVEIFCYGRTRLGKEIPVGRPRIRRRLRRFLSARGIGLVVANSLEAFRSVEAAADLGLPVIWMIHELAAGYQDRREWEEMRAAAQLADRLIFNSQIGLAQVPLLGRGLEAKSRVIYPGISLDRPGGEDSSPEREITRREEGPVLGCIGDISPQKGYRILIEAFAIVLRAHPRSRLVIAGRVPDRFRKFKEELDARIQELHLEGRVRFEGEFHNLRRRLQGLDILLHPSPSESFGRVVAEALAGELPVVAARSGGVEEIILDGETGCLVPPGDPEALAEGTLMILSDPLRAQSLARRGRREVASRFALARSVAAIEAEIRSLF